jgi:predicted Co/Zn/Cd cation transporter (cation efflux family)
MNERTTRLGVSESPWRAEDVVRWTSTSLVGVGAVVVAAIGAHSEKLFHSQYSWGVLAVIGMMVGSYAQVIWVLRGRRIVGERIEVLLRTPNEEQAGITTRLVGTDIEGARSLVAPIGSSLFHRPDCVLSVGRDVVADTRSDHEGAGRMPCGVCQP